MLIAKYYRGRDGSQPVKTFIDALPVERRARIHFQIERLNSFGETLDYPHTSQVNGELRELRAHYGRDLYRIYYRRSEQFAILLHIIEKRSAKLPAAETAIAEARWADFKARMDQAPRGFPRAVGSDAP